VPRVGVRGPLGGRPATVPAEADDTGDDSPAEVVEVVEVVDAAETVDEPAAAE
jgi:hypothetical protein